MAQKINELFLLELLFQETKCNALPWMSIRPCQEGSAILGGLSGHGTSPDRAGRSQSANVTSGLRSGRNNNTDTFES
jgi:hypothetical protein